MVQVNRPVFDQGLVRNDRKGEQAIKTTAPTTDKVMDLTSTDNLAAELNTKDVQFIRVQAGGEDVFLDISRMPKTEKDALIAQIKNKVSGAQKFNEFDPATFFKLGNQNSLRFGNPAPPGATAAVKDSQRVLEESLGQHNKTLSPQQSQIFALMNGDANVLNKADATQKVGDQKKPAEWYNGFQVSQNAEGTYEVSTYTSNLDKSERSYDLNTDGYKNRTGIEAYKQMLKDDFNFNGARTDIAKATRADLKLPEDASKWTPEQRSNYTTRQEELFVESVVRKFAPQHPNLSDPQLTVLAQEIWSYATTGADKNGRIEIGEMQGMLAQLDPEMVKSGSNNASSGYGRFTVTGADGTSFSLPKGDPYHGRGTILQTRHLMENFKADMPVRVSFAKPPSELQGYSNTILLADNSSSMGRHMQNLSGVVKAGGIEGQVTVGTYIDKDKPMIWSDAKGNAAKGPVALKAEQAHTLLQTQGTAHSTFRTDPSVTPGSAFIYGKENMNESGIIAGLSALENQPDKTGTGANTNQLVLFTDETDASTPEDLRKLQELAQQKGYDVKVVFTQGATFSIINVNDITPAQSNAAGARKTANSVDYALDWSYIATQQQATSYQWSQTGI